MECYPDGYRTSIQYFGLTDRNRVRTAIITIDRKWFPMCRYVRNDPNPWICLPSPPAPEAPRLPIPSLPPTKRHKPDVVNDGDGRNAVAPIEEEVKEQPEQGLSSAKYSLCLINFDAPHVIEGVCV